MPITVVAALIAENNQLLICQRSASSDFGGKWEFPGGKLEPGETVQAALRRELEEELGIEAEIGPEVWRTEHQYPGRNPVLLIFLLVRNYVGRIENRIFQQIRWETAGHLGNYDFLEGDLALIQKLAGGELAL